ncbi:MAG: hypothetical protein KJN96_11915 [Eudoraea sp.]|nr:hypothetical protein [Eudoraea sp.]MBT8223863.1 hypothetical protein [Eudoraea sp.]NNJ40978.1 hypothetical protein [Eudoraea sp.]
MKRNFGFWIIIIIGILLLVLLLLGQTLAVFNFDLAITLGLQETKREIGEVGIAFAKGFALADTLVYVPLLLIGLIGLLSKRKWGYLAMMISLGITVYWPVVHLYAIYIETEAINLDPEKYITFPITLTFLIIYGLFGMVYLYRNHAD